MTILYINLLTELGEKKPNNKQTNKQNLKKKLLKQKSECRCFPNQNQLLSTDLSTLLDNETCPICSLWFDCSLVIKAFS